MQPVLTFPRCLTNAIRAAGLGYGQLQLDTSLFCVKYIAKQHKRKFDKTQRS